MFELGRIRVKDYGKTDEKYCYHCHNESNWRLRSYSKWLVAFFMPVLPYNKKNAIVCPKCGYGQEISKEEFEELKDGLTLHLKKEKDEFAGMTETQINYIKAMREAKKGA